jgi:rod shape determining protein RodA
MIQQQNLWRQVDWVLLAASTVLVVIGFLLIASATRGAIDPELISRLPNQIRYAILGVVVVVLLTLMDYRLLGNISNWIYGLMLVLLLAVFFFGVEGDGGSQSWLNIGIPIQPAEIAKVLVIITLGQYLTQNHQKLDNFTTVIKSFIHIGVPTALIFIQPDLGMSIVFLVLWFTMIWGAGLRWNHMGYLAIIAVAAMPVLWSRMDEYQQERITTFISPSEDDPSFYNIRQAIVSIGSGGLGGKGYMQGSQTQARFLRVRHTDFIFAVLAEEFGFVGGIGVIALLGVVLARIVRAARTAADPLGSLLCYGVASFIFFQTFVSIGMNLQLVPVTGLTLPFVSSGGTSLLSTLAGIGLVQSVVIRRKAM